MARTFKDFNTDDGSYFFDELDEREEYGKKAWKKTKRVVNSELGGDQQEYRDYFMYNSD